MMEPNVFVLCTGRCGSVTFIKACSHITNFSSGHESRAKMIGSARLDYPARHIEADNRLSWFLGRLDERWGQNAFYVHLVRDREETARSYEKRIKTPGGISGAYRSGILMGANGEPPLEVCRDYVDTVNSNIRHFLRDKPNKMTISLESAKSDFRRFWTWIGADGDLDAALAEWDIRHNESSPVENKFIKPEAQTMSATANEYWESRKDSLYYQAVRLLTSHLGANAQSMADVGSAGCPYVDWFDWIPERTSIDLRNPYKAPGVRSITADFLEWEPDKIYDVVTCLQVLEHIPDAGAFAQKLLGMSKILIISVPFKWKPGGNKTHVHDPVDAEKMRTWFQREPNFSYRITEVLTDSPHLIQVYERDHVDQWNSVKKWRRLRGLE